MRSQILIVREKNQILISIPDAPTPHLGQQVSFIIKGRKFKFTVLDVDTQYSTKPGEPDEIFCDVTQ